MRLHELMEYFDKLLTKTLHHPWTWDQTSGVIGMILVLIAYILVSQKDIKPDGHAYHAMNFIGGICLSVNALASYAGPIFILELFWISISVINFVNIEQDKKYDKIEKGEVK